MLKDSFCVVETSPPKSFGFVLNLCLLYDELFSFHDFLC